MRQRTSWIQTHRSASTQRQAEEARRADDLYTMNREGGNPQPAVNEYESGDPSAWAEDVNSGASIEKEYQGGAVKRNELGFPEFRDDSFSHAGTRPWGKGGQYDNAKLATQRKAVACEKVARAILRTDDEKLITATALELMHLPTKSLDATVKSMQLASPAALSKDARFRRAMACTKLSALILNESAEETAIERLATLFNGMDDATLKGILRVVATSRVAEESEEHEKEESKEEEKEEHEKGGSESTASEKKEDEDEDDEDEGVLTKSDLDKLREMMEEVEEAGSADEKEEEAGEEGEEGDADLQNLFEGEEGEGQGEPSPAPTAACDASAIDITFDDGDDEPAGKPSMASDLNGLFDTEENYAQREIRSASDGYGQRTASSKPRGAKKIGQVQVRKASSIDDNLESLWERPQQ